MTPPRRVLFCDFRAPDDPGAFAARVRGMGFTDAMIGPSWEDDTPTFKPRVPLVELVRAFDALMVEGVQPWVMPWMHRDEAWIDAVGRWCADLVVRRGVGVCGDAEWGWMRGPGSSRPAEEAAEHWAFYARAFPLAAITGYGFLPASVEPLARVGGVGIPQAYADGKRPDPIYRPGALPAPSVRSWRKACAHVWVGGACYNLDHPGTADDGLRGMTKAADAMDRTDATGHAWWSEKHIGPGIEAWFKARYDEKSSG